VRFPNHVWQRVIRLMSLSRGQGRGRRSGRVSYQLLSINQLGAVYEALLSYRGFFAAEDLYEVKPAPKKGRATGEEEAEEEGEGEAEEAEAEDAPSSRRGRAGQNGDDKLEIAWFVPGGRLREFKEEERVYDLDDSGHRKLRLHPKGSFIYRLAGRDREKSASYYTPQVLTQCLVKYALKELLGSERVKKADDILTLTVCEPAMGSAAFLNEAVNQLADAYLERKQQEMRRRIPHEDYAQELQKVRMVLADRNVFGVDLNPVAVELAEVSIWLNAIYGETDGEGRPLPARVPWFGYQLFAGNSLIGARRQAYAATSLIKGAKPAWHEGPPRRVDDSTEDREPKYYVRQLMADFLPTDVREAWQIPAGGTPFGFEFISRATFRDVNFGELARSGAEFKVAGREAVRPGFRLCRHCGKVQRTARPGDRAAEQVHSFDCPKRGADEPANLLECLYLYREFESEALRILVPYTRLGVDDQVVQSFMAAVQLGLKRRFGGKVDHIRMVLQDEPGKDGGPRRHYVMLYDSVPGGTGYLHQLLAHDAKTLGDVLRMALEALTRCSCNDDPEKDGCYRCLYQYRLGRQMALVSRETAKAVLSELVEALSSIVRVDTISDIYINPNFDSVLEARFVESLRKLGGAGGLPPVKLVQDIVNGKAGYVLEVGGQRYRVEPQVEVGGQDGVSVPSKPDFVLWPWSAGSPRRPIAVFCDGWAYHKGSLRDDALKRSAILASGCYWVWSVTHLDVAAALAGSLATDLESPLVALARNDGAGAPAGVPRPQESAFTQNAVARLLQWLAIGAGGAARDHSLDAMRRDAAGLGFRMIPSTPQDRFASDAQRAQLLPKLPLYVREPGGGYAPMMSRPNGPVALVGSWPLVLAQGMPASTTWHAPAVALLDEASAADEEALHAAWRRWLQLANAMQFLPGFLAATMSGLDERDYDRFAGPGASSAAPASPSDQPSPCPAWQLATEQALTVLREGLRALAMAGAPPPEAGMELVDDRGRVVADAELAWSDEKLAVLRPDQSDLAESWKRAGWRVVVLDEALRAEDGRPWKTVVAAALRSTIENDEE
jgi:hypothetical protein